MTVLTKLMTSGLIALACPILMAAPAADLAVKGKIVVPACRPYHYWPSIDLKKINSHALNISSPTILPIAKGYLIVDCGFIKTKFSLYVTDNRALSVVANAQPNPALDDSYHFGLGSSRAGNFVIAKYPGIPPIADFYGQGAGRFVESSDSGATWTATDDWAIKPSANNRYAFALRTGPNLPLAINALHLYFSVTPAIVKSSDLDLTNEITLDGSATFTIHYE